MAQFPTYVTQYKIFRWTGLAKNDFESPTKRVLYRAYEVLLTMSYATFQVAFAYEAVIIAERLSFEAILHHCESFLICLGVLAKRLFVLGKKQQVKDLYWRIKKDFEDPAIKRIKQADEIIRDFDGYYKQNTYIFCIVGAAMAILFCAPSYANFPNEVPFPIWFLEKLTPSQVLMITLWQTLLVVIGCINYIAYDSLVWGFLTLTATRLHLVAKMWEHFADNHPAVDFQKFIQGYQEYPREKDRANVGKHQSRDGQRKHDEKITRRTLTFLKQSIKYYQDILEEMVAIENIYSFPLFIHMFGGAILIGIVVVFVIMGGLGTSFRLRSLVFFICTTVNLFLFSYYGTKVEEAKDTLTAAVYAAPWSEGDLKTLKLFLYKMSMMKRKIRYTAGGFVPINLETFLSLMKLSYNLLALLN